MRRLSCLLGLGLLAALPAPCAPTSWTVAAGKVELSLPADLPTDLGLDLWSLSLQLCPDIDPASVSSSGDCNVVNPPCGVAKNGPVDGTVGGGVLEAGRLTAVSLQLSRFETSSRAPLETACGAFDFTVRLDPTAEQPNSELVLSADEKTPTGTFAGVLRARVLLHLVPVGGTGRDVDLKVPLELPLGGPWSLAEAAAGASNLLLLVRPVEGGLQAVPSCLAHRRCCNPFCIAAALERFAAPGSLKN